jgi:hypothetical protein
MIEKLNKKVKERIDEYIGFDTDIIFNKTDYCEIFGGAVRDSISGDDINDIDFLCLRESADVLENILKINNYKRIDKLCVSEIQELYKNIRCIFSPITYMNNELKIVQIILPDPKTHYSISTSFDKEFSVLADRFFKLLREVDLSCCGLSYNGKIRENVSDAIIHCKFKVFKKMEQSEMYHPDRYMMRSSKLENKGWVNFERMTDEKKEEYARLLTVLNRNKKMLKLETFQDN